jgi:hypothetical protein
MIAVGTPLAINSRLTEPLFDRAQSAMARISEVFPTLKEIDRERSRSRH